MKPLIIISLFLCAQFLTAQETFKTDSIISDTIYFKKTAGKWYENQTVIDKNYNSVTTKSEIPDTAVYIQGKQREYDQLTDQLRFINQNIDQMQNMIREQRKQKDVIQNRQLRILKFIRQLRRK
jgi:predicted patatin/cPLA2 family phospholipase